MLQSIEQLKKSGFSGFKTISDLWLDASIIPKQKGVYVVINNSKKDFVARGTGGYFKGTDPNVDLNVLENKWVDNAIVVYIGKAGGSEVTATLQSRLKQYLNFGKGKPVGHKGGRYIWQIKNHPQLIVAWKPLTNEEPVQFERSLINTFIDHYGKLPFANLI